jgi:metal-sulfur cluster biosynthetic enzyme
VSVAKSGRPVTEQQVRTVLNEIRDPCSCAAGVPAGLVDMGLVRRIELTEASNGTQIRVTLAVTEPSCLMGGPFANEAVKRLGGMDGVAAVEVGLDDAMDWTPQHLAPGYRARLEAHRSEVRRRLLPILQGRSGS